MQRTVTVILLFLMMSSPHSRKTRTFKAWTFQPKKKEEEESPTKKVKGKFQYYATVNECLLQTPALNNEIWKLMYEN